MQRFFLAAQGGQLGLGGFLFVAGVLVVGQHVFIAKHLEHQVQQLLGAVFGELVGVALLQCQHLRHGGGKAGGFQAAAVLLHAQPRHGVIADGVIQRDVALQNGVVAHPVAALLLDAAQQGDFRLQQREERRGVQAALQAARVVYHAFQKRIRLAVVAHVALVIALAGALDGQQRAHGVQQGGLAGAVGADDGNDLRVQRHGEALPEVPVHHFYRFHLEHQACSSCGLSVSALSAANPGGPSCSCCAVRCCDSWPRRDSTSASAPSMMRGASWL